ncbi:putative sulfate exporter family transporter [Kiritimatiellaeota bacterium B1221]|nr:putative sulfate exporter family transporter [Kiritimatiellaeota bacterium B1221]
MNIPLFIQRITPGLFASLLLAGLAGWISGVFPQPGAVCVAIFLGLVLGNVIPAENVMESGFDFVEGSLLPVAIALMGTELQFHALVAAGTEGVIAVLPPMVLSILVAVPLGGFLGFGVHGALMLGIGNSVCGSSAVLAAAPALKVEKQQVAVAIAAVNLMGMIAMFALPWVAEALKLSGPQTANLLGGTLQAVGQVAASGFAISGQVGDHAMVVKMLRVVMIGPLVMILHQFFQGGTQAGKRRLPRFPGYILGFFGFAVLGSGLPGDHVVLLGMQGVAKILLVIAMVAVGSRIRISALLTHGSRALLLVSVLSFVQISGVLILILLHS